MRKTIGLLLLLQVAALLGLTFLSRAAAKELASTPTDQDANQPAFAKCLPPGIKLNDVVEAAIAGTVSGQSVKPRQITVEQKLTALKATCNRAGTLIDGNGRSIVFYHLTGCWGYPPPDYQQILQKQTAEIERLKQQNTVIEMTCNPSGTPIASLRTFHPGGTNKLRVP